MKKLLFFLLFCGVVLSCSKTDLPTPLSSPPIPEPTFPYNEPSTNDNKTTELKGPIFVDGLPLLKRTESSVSGITEYFYDEFKREVRTTNDKSVVAETRRKYNGDLNIETSFTRNPNYVSPNPQVTYILASFSFEYDAKNRVIASKSSASHNFYAYSEDGYSIQESNKSLIETNPQIRPGSACKYNSKGNMIEFTQPGQIDEYTYDDKVRPNSFNKSSFSSYTSGRSKNNVLTMTSTGGWFGNSATTYTYTYNKYNLPITSTSDKGDVITYTYYE